MTCWLPASCFLKVENVVEVAIAMRIITYTRSRFVIRSGGHNSNPGFSGIDNSGIVLDLAALNTITVSFEHGTASVGPGATWEKVYEKLEKHQLTVVGGRVASVGVGGLILGGNFVISSDFQLMMS